MGVPSSTVSRGSLSADTPPTASPQIGGDSDSPWSFIQSVAKARARRGEEGEERGRGGGRERRRGGGGASPGQDSFERSGRHSHHRHHHHHHNRHHHSHSHLHRQHRPHRGHQRTLSNPLVKVRIKEERERERESRFNVRTVLYTVYTGTRYSGWQWDFAVFSTLNSIGFHAVRPVKPVVKPVAIQPFQPLPLR